MSHAGFLRDQWTGDDTDFLALIRALHHLGDTLADVGVRGMSDAIDAAVPTLPATESDRALLRFVLHLALAPRTMTAERVGALKAAGHDDRAVHDIVHVVACFSYMNRLADGVGVTLLGRRELAIELFGADALAAHEAWGQP
ncbi:MAG: alkylhydroperoxidase family enzyme [Myxococcota bacterium]